MYIDETRLDFNYLVVIVLKRYKGVYFCFCRFLNKSICTLQKMNQQFNFLFLVLLAHINISGQNFDELRSSVTSIDQRGFIKISVLLESAPRVVAAQLATAVPDGHLVERQVYNWYNDFKDGKRTSTEDLPKPGRTREVTDDDTKETIKELILDSEGMSTEDLLYETGMSKTSLLRVLNEIGAKHKQARWIPHELTARQEQARRNIAGKLLARYQRESGFLDKIIAIDETWIKSYNPQDSRQSKTWLLPTQKP